jgi:hypothetical protein
MNIKKTSAISLVCLTVVLLLGGLAWAKSYHFTGTRIDPSAMGDIDLTHDRNGNGIVNVRVEHLAKPAMLTPPSTMYVVWFQQPGSDPENEGQLQVDNGLRGQLRTTTPLHNFDVFITAETDPTVRTPSDAVVLRGTIQE